MGSVPVVNLKGIAMRRLMLLFLLIGSALPSLAARRITVDQLEQIVSAEHSKPDAKAAQRLYELELTERMSTARLARAKVNLPGPTSRQALLAIADASAFLDLPAADIPANPTPDREAQTSMLALTLDYASKAISALPTSSQRARPPVLKTRPRSPRAPRPTRSSTRPCTLPAAAPRPSSIAMGMSSSILKASRMATPIHLASH